jgi:flavin-dependent dehydrogenase
VEFDVVVVGGGPAGSACAMRLSRKGARVALLEASDYARLRIGETLEPAVQAILERAGFRCDGGVPCAVPCQETGSAWGSSRVTLRPSIGYPHGRGWRLDRRAFDQRLFEEVGALGAAVFRSARAVDVSRKAGRWHFGIASGARVLAVQAPFAVEATGRQGRSPFAPDGRRWWLDRLVGVAVWSPVGVSTASRSRDAAVVEAAACGWWYSVGLPSTATLAVFFTDADCLPRRAKDLPAFLRGQLRTTEATLERAHFMERRWAECRVRCFDARSGIRRVAASDGWAATGDALMALDPLSGQGVTWALRSGLEVADWLADPRGRGSGMPEWTRRAAARFNRYVTERAKVYALEGRWQDSPFWQRRGGLVEDRPEREASLTA